MKEKKKKKKKRNLCYSTVLMYSAAATGLGRVGGSWPGILSFVPTPVHAVSVTRSK